MADGQEFCLRWNDFHSSFHVSLDALRGDDSFTDVTLSCSGHVLKAHRVILSACSAHFKAILKEVPPQQHAVMLLPTVELDVMRAILEFIYQGQVNVRQAKLGAFLHVAEKFGIQGLTDEAKKNAGKTADRSRAADVGAPSPSSKRRRMEQMHQPISPTVSGAGSAPPPPPPPPPPAPQSPEKTVNLSLAVKPEPDSVLDELEDMLEPQQDVAALDPAQDGQALMSVGPEDSGGAQPNAAPPPLPGAARSARPPVWLYYERLSETEASCRFCRRVIRGAPTSSGNFWVHLKRLHTEEISRLGGKHAALAYTWREAAGRRREAAAAEEAARHATVGRRGGGDEVHWMTQTEPSGTAVWAAPPPPLSAAGQSQT